MVDNSRNTFICKVCLTFLIKNYIYKQQKLHYNLYHCLELLQSIIKNNNQICIIKILQIIQFFQNFINFPIELFFISYKESLIKTYSNEIVYNKILGDAIYKTHYLVEFFYNFSHLRNC